MTNLDLGQFLDAVHIEHVVGALGANLDDCLVSGAHPAVLEGFLVGLFVVQLTDYHAR